ncbi:MAG: hypothetical protein KGZ25_10590, partial [Planctomycetes bacterium]|nr:hypothetical protein [Planctomycetota bacterium]
MRQKRIAPIVLFIFLWAVISFQPASGWETTPHELEEYSHLTLRHETPHTKWARPYAGGKMKVLYFIFSDNQGMETYAREAVELMQRFDVDITPVYWYRFYGSYWFGGVAGRRRINRLLKGEWDAFVFQEISPDKLPDQAKPLLAKAVQKGSGCVLIGVDEGKVLEVMKRRKKLPDFLADTRAESAATSGKGRIVRLPKIPRIEYQVGWRVRYEQCQQQLGRCLLWAADRTPQMNMAVEAKSVQRKDLPRRHIKLRWQNAARKPRCTVTLRRWDDRAISLGDFTCKSAHGENTLQLPLQRAGRYYVEAIAEGTQGVEAFTTCSFDITATPSIKGIRTERDWVEPGDKLAGSVSTFDDKGCRVRVRLIDRQGRILTRTSLARKAETQKETDEGTIRTRPFSFRIEPWTPMLVRLEAVLVDRRGEVVSEYRFVNISRRGRDRFNFVLWDFSGDQTLAPYMAQSMREKGVTSILSSHEASPAAAAHNLTWCPWTGGQIQEKRAESWNKPGRTSYFVNRMKPYRQHGVYLYSLGDEGSVKGAGTGP